jgi:hypothetical protein
MESFEKEGVKRLLIVKLYMKKHLDSECHQQMHYLNYMRSGTLSRNFSQTEITRAVFSIC